MSSTLRAHRPWGAKVSVSRPNQLTPVMWNSCPVASTSLAPAARSGLAVITGVGEATAGVLSPTPGAVADGAAVGLAGRGVEVAGTPGLAVPTSGSRVAAPGTAVVLGATGLGAHAATRIEKAAVVPPRTNDRRLMCFAMYPSR